MTPHRKPSDKDIVFLAQCALLANLSKDPNTQIGAMIVDSHNRIVSQGYNGPPPLIPDTQIDWSSPNKYPFICHAEDNAIHFGTAARGLGGLCDCRLYVTGKPCSRCMVLIARAEIRLVIYGTVQPTMCNDADWIVTQRIAELAGIHLKEFHPHDKEINSGNSPGV